MELLDCGIRYYDWGSHTAIARLQGRATPTTRPEAELWIGAHPGAPSHLWRDGESIALDQAIQADPSELLGDNRFDRLPFMLKLLAPERPLSLQAHPDAAQARAGYEREELAGIPRDSPLRQYVDPFHKPELLVALGDFEALCGFRSPAASADLIERLAVPALAPVVAMLRNGSDADRLRSAVARLLSWPAETVKDVIAAVVTAADGTYSLVGELGQVYPDDPGVLVSLLLNSVHLRAGDAIWMPAGNLHAYLRGVGVEIMAASDNVLRGGLTSKHVDVAELLKVVRYDVLADPVVAGVETAAGVTSWRVPVRDFALDRVRVDGDATLSLRGPRLVFCTEGGVIVDDGVAAVGLSAGEAAIGPAAAVRLRFTGTGEIFVATAG
jgi:mannose-6-phosphate isomerase